MRFEDSDYAQDVQDLCSEVLTGVVPVRERTPFGWSDLYRIGPLCICIDIYTDDFQDVPSDTVEVAVKGFDYLGVLTKPLWVRNVQGRGPLKTLLQELKESLLGMAIGMTQACGHTFVVDPGKPTEKHPFKMNKGMIRRPMKRSQNNGTLSRKPVEGNVSADEAVLALLSSRQGAKFSSQVSVSFPPQGSPLNVSRAGQVTSSKLLKSQPSCDEDEEDK